MKRPKDFRAIKMSKYEWDEQNALNSLSEVISTVCEKADEQVEWYVRMKGRKRLWARFLRMGTILLVAAAGVLPILLQIFTTAGKAPFSPAWASVLLSIGVLFIAIDRFFGFSTSWIRYITAQLQIKQIRESFELDWQVARASFGGKPPSTEQVLSVLASAKAFLEKVNEIVASETAKWIAEFMEALKQIEEKAKAGGSVPQTGSISLTVLNGADVSPPGWNLSIDHAPLVIYTGKTAAMIGLMPGDHLLRVTGTIGNRTLRAEQVATVRPSTVTHLEITLE